jgi:4-amino-4-deoxy-L-arabinose transferase-like glycosyltransferase
MNKRQLVLASVILLIAVFFRFWQIGNIPTGVTNDEAGGLFNAYSIAMTGRSIDGRFLPLSMNLDNSSSPVFIYLMVPFVRLLGVSAFATRLPFALLSLSSVILLYLITNRLFNNRLLALFAMFAMAVSPWHIHMNRGAYDGPITFFLLLSLYVFLRGLSSGSILWSLPCILISFYSYHATKFFWVAFVPLIIAVYWRKLRNRKREILLFIIGCIAIGISFWYVLVSQDVTRQKVLLLPDASRFSQQVAKERTLNSAPQILRILYSNKLTVYSREVFGKYIQEFSPQFLFVTGEGGIFGTYNHGELYVLDFLILIFGFVYLARTKNTTARNLIIGSILLAPLSSSFTEDVSYGLRGIFLLPFLMIVLGCGFYQIYIWANTHKTYIGKTIKIACICLYAVSAVGYAYLYFFRYSIYGAELWFASSRDVSQTIGVLRGSYDRVWIGNAGSMFLFQYGLYNQSNLSSVVKAWNDPWPKHIDKVAFLENCLTPSGHAFNPSVDLPNSTLYVTRESCHEETTPSATIRDRGEPLQVRWKFYEHKE